jgi:hypothetical protein
MNDAERLGAAMRNLLDAILRALYVDRLAHWLAGKLR